jgi:hypothetical protein
LFSNIHPAKYRLLSDVAIDHQEWRWLSTIQILSPWVVVYAAIYYLPSQHCGARSSMGATILQHTVSHRIFSAPLVLSISLCFFSNFMYLAFRSVSYLVSNILSITLFYLITGQTWNKLW